MTQTEGIVINTHKYQENSKLIYVITNDKFIILLVRASCKYESKNFQAAQELILLNFDIAESKKNSFSVLKSYEILDNYKYIKSNYEALMIIMDMYNIIYKFHDHITNISNLYYLIKYITGKINNICLNNFDINLIKMYKLLFYTKLLYLFGVGPNFKNCTLCGSSSAYNFSVSAGGLVCDKCKCEDKFIGEYVGLFKVFYLGKLDVFEEKLLNEYISSYESIYKLIKVYYDKYLGIRL